MPKLPGVYPFQQILFHNPPVQEMPEPHYPTVSDQAVVGVGSMIIGDVRVADDVFVGFHNIIRADSAGPFYIGPKTNIQDFVLIHCHPGQTITVGGEKMGVYFEGENSVLHHAAPHGPLFVGRNTFIGQHVAIYGAIIGRNCVLMHGAIVANHVKIADNRFLAPGQAVWTQQQADALPEVPAMFKGLNQEIVDFYFRVGKSYQQHTPLAF